MNNLNYKFRNPKLLNAILVCVFSIFFTLNVSAQRDGDGGGLDCPPPSAPTSIECAGDNCPQTCACDIQGPTGNIPSGMPVDFAMLGGIPNDYVAWEIRLTTNNSVIASGSGSLIDDFAFPTDPRGESFNYSVCFTTGYYPQSCGGANSGSTSCCKVVTVTSCPGSTLSISTDPVFPSSIIAGVPFDSKMVVSGSSNVTYSWRIKNPVDVVVLSGNTHIIVGTINTPDQYTLELMAYDNATSCSAYSVLNFEVLSACKPSEIAAVGITGSATANVGSSSAYTGTITGSYTSVEWTVYPIGDATPFMGTGSTSSAGATSTSFTTPAITFNEVGTYTVAMKFINSTETCSVTMYKDVVVGVSGCTSGTPSQVSVQGAQFGVQGQSYIFSMVGGIPNNGNVSYNITPVAPFVGGVTPNSTGLAIYNASTSQWRTPALSFQGTGMYEVCFTSTNSGTNCNVTGCKSFYVTNCTGISPSACSISGNTTTTVGTAEAYTMSGGIPNDGVIYWELTLKNDLNILNNGYGSSTNLTFANPGQYTLRFTTYNDHPACSTECSIDITVNTNCTSTIPGGFTITSAPSTVFAGSPVTFTATQSAPVVGTVTWSIVPSSTVNASQGNGTSTGAIVFVQTGVYTITFTATNGVGCVTSTSHTFIVKDGCELQTGTDCSISNNMTSNAGSTNTAYNFSYTGGYSNAFWSVFPSSGVSISPSATNVAPSITFANAGTYTVKLYTWFNGCIKECSNVVTITTGTLGCTNPLPSAMTIGGPTSVTTGTSVTYSVTSGGTPSTSTSWVITPSTGVSASSGTGTSATVTFSTPGTYVISFTAINGTESCKTTNSLTITVTSGGCTQPSAMTLSGPTSTTTGTSVTYSIASGGTPNTGVTWAISPSAGVSPSSGTGTSATVTYSTTGSYTITFTAVNGSSTCNRTASLTTNVTCTSAPSACTVTGSSNGVTGAHYSFTMTGGTPNTGVTWAVVPSTGASPASGTGTSANISFSAAGTYDVVFTATNGACTSTCSKTIVITQNVCPYCTVYGPSSGIVGSTYNFNSVLSSGTYSSTWSVSPAAGVSSSTGTGNNANITFNTAGTYTVTFTYNTGTCGIITCDKTVVIREDCLDNQPQVYGPSNTLIGETQNYYVDNIYESWYPNASWTVTNSSGTVVISGSGSITAMNIAFSNIPAGSYTITFVLTNAAGTCSIVRTKTVNVFSSCPTCSTAGITNGVINTGYVFTSNIAWSTGASWSVSPSVGVTNASGICNPVIGGPNYTWTTQTISFSQAGTYTLTFSYNCGPCGVVTCERTIVIAAAPVCTDPANVSLTVPNVVTTDGLGGMSNIGSIVGLDPGYSVTWSLTPTTNVTPTAGTGTLAQAVFSVLYSTQYTITFTATKAGCPNIVKTKTFTVAGCNNPPPFYNISGPTSGSQNVNYTFNSNVTASSYFWSVTGGSGYTFVSGNSGSSTVIKFTGPGTYSIHLKACNGTSSCCTQDYHTIVIN